MSVPSTQGRRDFLALLDQNRDQIAMLLPQHVSVDRVVRVARTAYLSNSYLQKCTPASILTAVSKGCELGLETGSARNHAYLVPFKDQCTLIVGFQGVLELARRSGEYRKIDTRIVYANERFEQAPHLEPPFVHFPLIADRGEPVAVYSYVVLKSGESSIEVMTRDEIEAIRRRLPDRQRNSPAWQDFWGEMARKIVLKRHLKRMPQSVELATAIEHSNQTEGFVEFGGSQLPAPESTPDPSRSGSARLADRLGVSQSPPPAAIESSARVYEGHEPELDDLITDVQDDIVTTEGGRDG